MNEAQAAAAIRAYFATQWTGPQVAYDDVPFDIPAAAPFVRLNIRHVLGDQTTMGDPGNNRHRQEGAITAQVFAPQGHGSVEARAHASQIAALFRGKTVSDIHFYQTAPKEVGNDGAGFYQINVNIRFRYDILA